MRSAALRQDDYPPSRRDPWYTGKPPLVPGVELDEGHAVVCPICPEGVHIHGDDGYHNPGCNGPRGHNISFEAWRPRGLRPCAFGQAADEGSFNAARIG